MSRSTKWFLLISAVFPLHMGEQLIFGIGELTKIKQVLAVYYGWFSDDDYATVVLVILIGSAVNLLAVLIALGGHFRRAAFVAFGLIGVSEVHHIAETIAAAAYTSGTATAVPYMAFGLLLIRAAWRNE